MNTAEPALEIEIDAMGGDLRPCEHLPRPIHHPETSCQGNFGGGR
jgi:hypothetical protein